MPIVRDQNGFLPNQRPRWWGTVRTCPDFNACLAGSIRVPYLKDCYTWNWISHPLSSVISIGFLSIALCGGANAQQSGLPINAAASVNGAIVTNDMWLNKASRQPWLKVKKIRPSCVGRWLKSSLKSKRWFSEFWKSQFSTCNDSSKLFSWSWAFNIYGSESDFRCRCAGWVQQASSFIRLTRYDQRIQDSDIVVASEADAQAALNRIKKGGLLQGSKKCFISTE